MGASGLRLMGDHSKRERRGQRAIKAQEQPPGQSGAAVPLCWCGQPVKYEVNRG